MCRHFFFLLVQKRKKSGYQQKFLQGTPRYSSCLVGAGMPDIVRGVYPYESAYGNILLVFREKNILMFWRFRKKHYLCTRNRENRLLLMLHAEIAQLVEHNLAKVRVASSSLVFRSKHKGLRRKKPRWRNGRRARFRCVCRETCRFESCSGH